jgi:hypothetical protein
MPVTLRFAACDLLYAARGRSSCGIGNENKDYIAVEARMLGTLNI